VAEDRINQTTHDHTDDHVTAKPDSLCDRATNDRCRRPAKDHLEQKEREEVLRSFRSRNTRILVATDVMSRGIDIKEINLVVNYDCPSNAEDYVHRVGRTARSDAKGMAITLVNGKDMRRLSDIESLIGYEIDRGEMPEHLGQPPVWRDSSQRRNKGRRTFNKNKRRNPHNKNHKSGGPKRNFSKNSGTENRDKQQGSS
jgi:superfamily II DNA/RNA helicase